MATPLQRPYRYYSFKLTYKKKTRTVDVYSNAPYTGAEWASGRASDEQPVAERINPADEKFRAFFTPKRPKAEEMVEFYEGMASAIERNLDFKAALDQVITSATTPVFRGILANIYYDAATSSNRADLFARFPEAFDKLTVAIIRQGFDQGDEVEAFRTLAEYTADQMDLQSDMVSAMLYPAFLSVAAAAAMIFLNIVVFPSFMRTFTTLNFNLPLVTRILFFLVKDVFMNPVISIAPPVLAVAALIWRRKLIEKPWVQRGLLRLPLAGWYYRKRILARSLYSLSLCYARSSAQKEAFGLAADISARSACIFHVAGIFTQPFCRSVTGSEKTACTSPTR
jgi:type II secretory pathway component PulF